MDKKDLKDEKFLYNVRETAAVLGVYGLVTLRSVLESSWCGKTDLVLLVYFISVSIVKKDGDDIIKTC